jgi:glutamate--cysteine ligase catalytic subunit
MVIQLDPDTKNAMLSLCQTDVLAKLQTTTSDMDAVTDPS